MSDFDVNAFLNAEVDEPMATQVEKPPEGDWLARIAKISGPDEIATKWVKGPEGGRTWTKIAIPFELFDPELLTKMGRKNPIRVTSDWELEVDSATSRALTGPGKNVQLGRLRAALGQNIAGQPWSFSQLPGAGPVKVTIKHRKNPQNPDDPFVNVTKVSPAS